MSHVKAIWAPERHRKGTLPRTFISTRLLHRPSAAVLFRGNSEGILEQFPVLSLFSAFVLRQSRIIPFKNAPEKGRFTFVPSGVAGVRALVQTWNPYAFYMLICLLVFGSSVESGTISSTTLPVLLPPVKKHPNSSSRFLKDHTKC